MSKKPLLLADDTKKRTSDPLGGLPIFAGEPNKLYAHDWTLPI